MRTALCLFGKVGGMGGKNGKGKPIDFRKCHQHYKKYVIDINNCDVFIHSWSTELEKKLTKLYSPKSCRFEKQVNFKVRARKPKDKRDEFLHQSRWYSTKKVIELKNQYEKENNFQYDWVIIGRFDLMFLTDLCLSELDNRYFYAANNNHREKETGAPAKHKTASRWNKTTARYRRFADLWFFSSSEFMDKFSLLYDRFYEYSPLDPHNTVWKHLDYLDPGNVLKRTRFIFYKWFDYAMYREWYGAKK